MESLTVVPSELMAPAILEEQSTASNSPASTSTQLSSSHPALNLPPNFQDIDSDDSSFSDDEQDIDAIISAAETAFTQDQVDEMLHYLRERGLFAFITRYVTLERVPIPTLLLAFGVLIPPTISLPDQLRVLKITCSKVLRHREKLEEYNTVDDAVELIRGAKKILVLTGAGVSTSCGIPDFRSPTGLYARLKEEHWELEDPQEMFDLAYFKEKPNVFYSFAKEIYPSNFVPSPCHRFVKLLELNEKLLRNYTQNIDGLFESVGVERMLNCHGSFATASCLRCRARFPGSAIEADVFAQRVPLCPICSKADETAAALRPVKKVSNSWKGGEDDTDDEEEDHRGEWDGKPLIKPDIVFFGEMLSDEFDQKLLQDREDVDLLIVIGTSLRVSPVAQIVSHLPHSVPQILINRDPITHANFDIHLLGDGDTIVRYLSSKLGPSFDISRVQVENGDLTPLGNVEPERVGESHVWLFPGANRESRWVEAVRRAYEDSEDEDEDEDEEEGEGKEKIVENGEGEEVKEATGLEVPVDERGTKSRSRTRSNSPVQEEERAKKARMD